MILRLVVGRQKFIVSTSVQTMIFNHFTISKIDNRSHLLTSVNYKWNTTCSLYNYTIKKQAFAC